MATELSMNGKKKIETIQKEFSNKFPFLTLIFLNEKRESIDVSKTLSEIRKSKGDDISIIASLKVNNLEKKFLKNYGLIVEVAYQKEGEVVMTQPDEEKTLNELNNWCELNGCSKIRYQGTSKVPQKAPNVPEVSGNKLFEEDLISYAEEKLEAIKKAIKVLRDPSFGDKSVEVEIYTQDFVSRDALEKCEVEGTSILIKRTNWWEDSSWVSIHTKESAIEILLNLYKYGTYEGLNEPEVSWRFENSGKNDNGCDLEVLNSAEFYMVKNILPDEVLTDDGAIDVWELRDYYGYSEVTVDKVDFEDIDFEKILFKLEGQELLLIPSEINDLVSIGSSVDDNEPIKFSDDFIDQAIAEHNAHEDGFDLDFKEVKIGEQVWMLSNLNVEKFRNGDPIPYVENQEEWMAAFEKRQPAYCNYNNDPKYGQQYGKLYNWYAVNDSRGLAPEGWHIPSENEFNVLFSFIEDDDEENYFKLKCDVSWGPDSDGTNETGFTALPAGFRNPIEGFDGIYDNDSPEEAYTAWWCSSEIEGDLEIAVYKEIEYEPDGNLSYYFPNKGSGYSVRCIKGNLPEETKGNEQKEAEIDPVLEIVKDKLVEYRSDIVVNPNINSNSISFKLPFVSNDDKSLLILSLEQGKYQMKFQCFDEKLVEELIAFKPDVIKKYTSGVAKDDLCKNEGELLSAVVDFICLLSRLNMDFGDGTKIHYVGLNMYSKEINGEGRYLVFVGKEANVFSIYDDQEIGAQKWMTRNLQTSFFRNGELIKQAKTEAEWLWATENKVPAWCYYNQDPANGPKYGYLYNWYAINDPRGLAPKGWEIPSQQDYQKLLDYFKTPQPGVKIQLKPAGYRLDTSTFNFIDQIGFWWTSDEDGENARFATFAVEKSHLSFGSGLKSLGLSVLCIEESLISEGLQELIDEGIAVNLYRNPKMYEDDCYYLESELQSKIKEYGSMFLDHLFAIPFKSGTKGVVNKVFEFLDKQLKVDYKSLMFKPEKHHPVIGIFNSKSNELLGVGIGRKNRIFFVSTDKTINDQNYRTFSKFDYCNVIGALVSVLENAADAQLGIMFAIENGDSESEEEYSESLDKEIDNLLIAYPKLPNSIGDLSPGDF